MKVHMYIIITVGMAVFMQFMGITTLASSIFGIIGFNYNPTNDVAISVNTTASGFFSNLFDSGGSSGIGGLLALAAAAASGIIIGLYTKASAENFIILPLITTTLVLFVSCFVGVINYVNSNFAGSSMAWAGGLIALIFFPLTIGFILSLVEFFRGTD